jgi:hypothetical protein
MVEAPRAPEGFNVGHTPLFHIDFGGASRGAEGPPFTGRDPTLMLVVGEGPVRRCLPSDAR